MTDKTQTSKKNIKKGMILKKWAVPVSYILGVGAVVILSSYFLSFRPEKSIVFIGKCKEITVPKSTTLKFFPFEQAYFRGFSFIIENIHKATLKSDEAEYLFDSSDLSFSINPLRHTDPISFAVIPIGNFGQNSFIDLPENTIIKGSGNDSIFKSTVTLQYPKGHTSEIKLSTESVVFSEINRMRPDKIKYPSLIDSLESYSLKVYPISHRLLNMNFKNVDSIESPVITLSYKNHKSKIFKNGGNSEVLSIQNSTFRLTDCIDPILKIDQFDSQKQPKGVPYDFVFKVNEVKLQTLEVLSGNEPDSDCNLNLSFRGTVMSIKAGDVEILPTQFEIFLQGSLVEKGVLGLVFAAICYLVGNIFKRAIDVLVKQLIPDSK